MPHEDHGPSSDPAALRTVVMGDRTIRYTERHGVPRDMAIEMGRSLGISPIAYLSASPGPPRLDPAGQLHRFLHLTSQLAPLVDAAALLGYEGAGIDELLQRLSVGEPSMPGSTPAFTLVALVPDPTAHKSAPPGAHWLLHTEPFHPSVLEEPDEMVDPSRTPGRRGAVSERPSDGSGHIRVVVVPERRNEASRVASLLLWDDPLAELARRSATDAGADAAILLNTVGHVAGLDSGTLLVERSAGTGTGAIVTPPLGEGAIDTAPRRASISAGEVVEGVIGPDELRTADRLVCMYPWGDRVPVELA